MEYNELVNQLKQVREDLGRLRLMEEGLRSQIHNRMVDEKVYKIKNEKGDQIILKDVDKKTFNEVHAIKFLQDNKVPRHSYTKLDKGLVMECLAQKGYDKFATSSTSHISFLKNRKDEKKENDTV